jgi:hypothetical protein
LKDLYCINPLQPGARLDAADIHRSDLENMNTEIKQFYHSHRQNVISGRQRRIQPGLNLALAHARTMLHQPFLLADPLSYTLEQRSRLEHHIQECLQAAKSIAEQVKALYEHDPAFAALYFAHYCGYFAAVVFYIYVIKAQGQSPNLWLEFLKTAETLQSQISASAEKGSFASRCSQVLVELRYEVAGHLERNGNQEHLGVQMESLFEVPASRLQEQHRTPIFNLCDALESSVVNRIDRWGFSSLTGY